MSRFGTLARAGARAVRARWRLWLALYVVQLAIALAFTLAAARTLSALFAHQPLFDRAVQGDLVAFARCFRDHGDAALALAWVGVSLALAYGVLGFYLAAGTYGALAGRGFGDGAATRFFPYLRLWLWSIIPYGVAAFVALMGFGLAARDAARALTPWQLYGLPLACALPGVLLWWLVACAVDHARALLATGDDRRALRAFLRAFRLVATRPVTFAHYLAYAGSWLAVTLLYLWLTADLTGALGLLALRQLVLALRFALRFATSAGQIEMCSK